MNCIVTEGSSYTRVCLLFIYGRSLCGGLQMCSSSVIQAKQLRNKPVIILP